MFSHRSTHLPFALMFLPMLLELLVGKNIFLASAFGRHCHIGRRYASSDGSFFMMNSYLDNLSSKSSSSHTSAKIWTESERVVSELQDLKSSLSKLRTKLNNTKKSSRLIEVEETSKSQVLECNIIMINSNVDNLSFKHSSRKTGDAYIDGSPPPNSLSSIISALGSRLDKLSSNTKINSTASYPSSNCITPSNRNRNIGNQDNGNQKYKFSPLENSSSKPTYIIPVGSSMSQKVTTQAGHDGEIISAIGSYLDNLSISSISITPHGRRDAESTTQDSNINLSQNLGPAPSKNLSTSPFVETLSQSKPGAMNPPASPGRNTSDLYDFSFKHASTSSPVGDGFYQSIVKAKKYVTVLSPNQETLSQKPNSPDSASNSVSLRSARDTKLAGRSLSAAGSNVVHSTPRFSTATGKSFSQSILVAMKRAADSVTRTCPFVLSTTERSATSKEHPTGMGSSTHASYCEEESSTLTPCTSAKPSPESKTNVVKQHSNLGMINTLMDTFINNEPIKSTSANPGGCEISTSYPTELKKQVFLSNSSAYGTEQDVAKLSYRLSDSRSLIVAEPASFISTYGATSKKQPLRSLTQPKAVDSPLYDVNASANISRKDLSSRVLESSSFFFAMPVDDDTSSAEGINSAQPIAASQQTTPPFFLVLPANDAPSLVGANTQKSTNFLQQQSADGLPKEKTCSANKGGIPLTNAINIALQRGMVQDSSKKSNDRLFLHTIPNGLRKAFMTGLCIFAFVFII